MNSSHTVVNTVHVHEVWNFRRQKKNKGLIRFIDVYILCILHHDKCINNVAFMREEKTKRKAVSILNF